MADYEQVLEVRRKLIALKKDRQLILLNMYLHNPDDLIQNQTIHIKNCYPQM